MNTSKSCVVFELFKFGLKLRNGGSGWKYHASLKRPGYLSLILRISAFPTSI